MIRMKTVGSGNIMFIDNGFRSCLILIKLGRGLLLPAGYVGVHHRSGQEYLHVHEHQKS